jgi:hypothetical protein
MHEALEIIRFQCFMDNCSPERASEIESLLCNIRDAIIVLFVETPRKFITVVNYLYIYYSNKFTWCFHKQNYYIFNRHANIQRTY